MTATSKKFNGAPFGTQKKRFDHFGIHPKLTTPGSNSSRSTSNKLGPGCYEVSASTLKRPSTGPGWDRQYETMTTSKIPHILYRDEWLRKKEQKRKLGPGSYNHNKFDLNLSFKQDIKRGLISTRSSRFPRDNLNSTPGPGSYGKDGIPEFDHSKFKTFSKVGLLDSGSQERGSKIVGCHLAPGTYNTKNSIEEALNKITSVRGPYDVFSTDRTKYNTGHRAVQLSELGPGQYEDSFSSFLDIWKGRHRRYHGRFSKQMKEDFNRGHQRIFFTTLSVCPRNPSEPAPNTYQEEKEPEAAHQQDAPFHFSSKRFDKRSIIKFLGGLNNPVGVGRYDVDKPVKVAKEGCTSAFKASERFPLRKYEAILKERIKDKNIENQQRNFLLKPPGPYSDTALANNDS